MSRHNCLPQISIFFRMFSHFPRYQLATDQEVTRWTTFLSVCIFPQSMLGGGLKNCFLVWGENCFSSSLSHHHCLLQISISFSFCSRLPWLVTGAALTDDSAGAGDRGGKMDVTGSGCIFLWGIWGCYH